MARLNTQLESKGAEFLVLGQLLIRGIETYCCHQNQQGYDLMATKGNKACRIQVKSRYYSGSDSFPIKEFDCDFVVFCGLNRGYEKCKANGETGMCEPVFYVLPVEVVKLAQDGREKWNKVHLRQIDNVEQYSHSWDLISEFVSS